MNIIEGSPGATSNAPLEGANSLTLTCGRLSLPFIAINLVWCKTANLMTQRAGGLFQSVYSNPTAPTQPLDKASQSSLAEVGYISGWRTLMRREGATVNLWEIGSLHN